MPIEKKKDVPNPGSGEAARLGCKCPVFDNNGGVRAPWPDGWWINVTCTVHADNYVIYEGDDQ